MNQIIPKALFYAYEKHKKDKRKGTTIPYIVHPVDVASILIKERNHSKVSDELIAAGLLHDVVEDTETSFKDIEKEFGKKVMILVKAASEPEKHKVESEKEKRKSWKGRKEHTIELIKKEKRDAKLLSCADKLANIRDMINDKFTGNEKEFWKRFNTSPEETKWYYQIMCKAYRFGDNIKDTNTFKMFAREVKTLTGEKPMKKERRTKEDKRQEELDIKDYTEMSYQNS
ncbi:MAG: HD domain-containing protein [Candidatus Nanoarchaeia archaeon]|jgi:(p)ppGpp synthase/HD superfamily hydrolase|nr:HD domain-containing protein [Candidatus Nanoarchaeia archaeon]|tara:strand:+ start:6746 stop:7432 length:687 start_codon:yes stop_codon:yes gene_type:complete